MQAKYFTADNRDAAVEMAEKFFSCPKDLLTIDDIGGGDDGKPCQILAISGNAGLIRNADASFGVWYEKDGVWLEIYSERGEGGSLDVPAMVKHLNRKNLSGFDQTAVQMLVAAKKGRIKIAPFQPEYIYGEEIATEIAKDEMSARAWLLAPEPGGPILEYETAVQKLQEAGVVHGVRKEELQRLLSQKDYGEPFTVAHATPVKDGEEGKLIFHFSTDARTGRPREIGGGRVDYRSLDLYEPVTEGNLLVTRIAATEGEPGITVKGRTIKQKPGKEVNLPKGKNVIINDEKTEMRAKCSGMVDFLNKSINVSSVYKINGDCDLSVGNIDFDGSVSISGSVRSGHTIKASGGITVGGAVEAATLIAGGNVEVKGGMQGADKGRIEAGGSITIMFIERGTAIADGSIKLDVSIHSTLEAGGTITAKGRRGAIIGGRAGAAGNVTANFLGTVSRTQTEVEVGMMPRKRIRIQNLEKEIEKLKAEIVKLDQLDAYLAATKEKLDPETWDKLNRSGLENRRADEQMLEDNNLEIQDLKYELEHATEGKVHVTDTAFDGTRIIIGNGIYKVTGDIQYATFRYKDAEVIYGPCEISKSKE